MKRLVPALLLLAATACSGGGTSAPKGDALVVVSAPLTTSPWVGEFVERGAQLAAKEIDAGGGRHVRVQVVDNAGSAQTTVAQARQAVSDGAVAFITDGVGAKAVAAVTDPVKLPVFITFEGGASLTDPKALPSLFRLAPANVDLCRRLADYLADVRRGQSVALVSDDSAYGVEGAANAKADLLHDEVKVVSEQTVPTGARDVSAQVLAARRSGAKVLVVWARAAGVASVIRTARSTGWDVPVYTGPAGEDPLVRQQLADHPQWLDGTVFVSFRITSESGGAPFAAYRKSYEKAYGPDTFGVTSGGKQVVQPPDWSMYSYDAVQLVEAALARGKKVDRTAVYDGIQSVVITGANGDERGYGPDDREGVSPDDMYFAEFRGMRFYPKRDDVLSTSLPESAAVAVCGRYASARRPDDLVSWYDVQEPPEEELAPSWNVAPTDPVYAVVQSKEGVRQLRVLRWGLVPSWSKDAKGAARMINARQESVKDKPAFRKAFASRRCLVPADGYYEWKTEAGEKQPYFLSTADPLSMAGLYEHWKTPEGDWLSTVTVITTSAPDDLGEIHDRTPLLVPREHWGVWLDRSVADPGDLLVPGTPGVLDAWPVGKAVGNVRNNGPELVAPLA